MEHRHQSYVSQVFERGYHRSRRGQMENVQTHGLYSSSQRGLEFRPFVQSSSSFVFTGPDHHASLPRQIYGFFPQFPASGRFYPAPENAVHAYAGQYNWHTLHEVENGSLDHTRNTGRGPLKRKRNEISVASERGNTSRHNNAGSSSDSFEFPLEQPTSGSQQYPFSSMGLHQYRDCSLSYHNEDHSRNVRSRHRLDVEVHLSRTYQSDRFSHHYYSTARNHFGPVDLTWLNANRIAYDGNHVAAFSAARGSFQTLGSFGLRTGMIQNSARCIVADISGYSYDSNSNRNPLFSSSRLHGLHSQAAKQDCNSYFQRTIPSYMAGLSIAHWGQGAASTENHLQYLSESYSSRSSMPFPAGGWHSYHQNRRSRTAVEEVQSLSNAVVAHDHMRSEAQIMMNHSPLYASRIMFDQYRDMRLDIDNMSYEELLALGERIGNVSTGLSKDGISKCLEKTAYSTPDESKKEGNCAICLEGYKDEDEIGMLKNCRHDYHVKCIEKWLSTKNTCPICQASALE